MTTFSNNKLACHPKWNLSTTEKFNHMHDLIGGGYASKTNAQIPLNIQKRLERKIGELNARRRKGSAGGANNSGAVIELVLFEFHENNNFLIPESYFFRLINIILL